LAQSGLFEHARYLSAIGAKQTSPPKRSTGLFYEYTPNEREEHYKGFIITWWEPQQPLCGWTATIEPGPCGSELQGYR